VISLFPDAYAFARADYMSCEIIRFELTAAANASHDYAWRMPNYLMWALMPLHIYHLATSSHYLADLFIILFASTPRHECYFVP